MGAQNNARTNGQGYRSVSTVYGHRASTSKVKPSFCLILCRLTVANEMLSIVGSLQPDPFSPAHSTGSEAPQPEGEDNDEAEEEVVQLPELDGLEDSDDEDDPFAVLGKSADVELKKDKVTAVKEKKKQKRKAAGDDSQSKKKTKRRHVS